MTTSLAENGYGKRGIRLVKVERGAERHELRDLTVDIRFEGDFAAAHLAGDNRLILPTDTMKNTVYALAAGGPLGEVEDFGLALGRHFLAGNPQVRRVEVRLAEHLWERVVFPGAVIENWDSYANGTVIPDGSTLNGITYLVSGAEDAAVSNGFIPTTAPNSLGSTAGGFFGAGHTVTFTFAAPVQAFGIDINTFATANGAYQATTNLGEIVNSAFDPFPCCSTGQFIGFFTTLPFTSLTISAPGQFSYTLDTLRQVPVPEPASLLLLGSGLAAIARARRRSRA